MQTFVFLTLVIFSADRCVFSCDVKVVAYISHFYGSQTPYREIYQYVLAIFFKHGLSNLLVWMSNVKSASTSRSWMM